MKVADLMGKDLVTVPLSATVGEAIVTLADAHVSGLPVVDHEGYLVGVLSTTDLLTSLAERGRERDIVPLLDETSVSEIMTPRPKTVAPGSDVHEAAQQMLYLGIHRLFVESNDELVGVISQTDIVQAFATGKL